MPLTTYTSGEVLTAASLNDNLAYAVTVPAAVPGGLVLISATTIGTTVASVTVSGAFSATYDNYKIIVTGGATSANPANLAFKLGATTTGYYWAHNGFTFANATSSIGAGNQANWRTGAGSPKILSMKIDILSPFLSEETSFSGQYQVPTTTGIAINNGGFLDNTTSYTDFTITPSTGTITGGTIRVYGYANS